MSVTNPSIASLTSAGNALMSFGEDLSGMFKDTFPGVYQSLVDQAKIDPERYVAQASADTQAAFENSRNQQRRDMTRMGVNPNSGRFAALEQNWARALAAAKSGAMTDARWKAADASFARTQVAAGVGLNLGNMATSAMSSAASAHSAAGNLTHGLNAQEFDVQREEADSRRYDAEVAKARQPQDLLGDTSPAGAPRDGGLRLKRRASSLRQWRSQSVI